MKKIILAFFCLVSLKGISQISLAYSGHMGTFSASSLLPAADGGYLAVKKIEIPGDKKNKSWNDFRQTVWFVRYDKDFKQAEEVQMTASNGICSGHFSEFKKAGDKYWFIYLEPGADNAMGNIKAVEVDPLTLQQKEAKTVAAAAALDHSISSARLSYYHHYMTGSSPAGKFSYIYIELTNDDCFISCLDADMKPVWGRKQKKMDAKDGGICSMEVDDNGYLYTGLQSKKDVSLSIHSPAGQASRYDIKLSAGKAREILFHPVKNSEQVMVSGTYMEDDFCTGVYKALLSTKGELNNIVTTVFPKPLVESMDKEGFAATKSRKYGLHPAFAAVPVRSIGGRGWVMEYRREAGGGAGAATTLLGGSLIYVDLSASEPAFSRVPKYSVSGIPFQYVYNAQYERGCMYYAYPHDSKLILFYYDSPENLTRDLALDAKPVNPKNQVLFAAVISKHGSIKRQQVTTKTLSSISSSGLEAAAGTVLVPVLIEANEMVASVRL